MRPLAATEVKVLVRWPDLERSGETSEAELEF